MKKKARWSSVEDDILREYVKEHGEGNWRLIEENSVLRRSGKSCRLRWRDHLRSDLKKSPISIEEEALLIRLHKKMGNKWSRIAKHFPGRTDNELKNFWNTRRRRRSRDLDQTHEQIDAQSPRRCSADLLEIPAFVTLCFLASGAQAFYARMFARTFGNRMPDLSIVSASFLRLERDRKSLLRFRSGTEAGLRGLVFDLNLPPAEPPDRRFVVGYALLPKKRRSLIRPSLVSAARDRGVYLVPVDPSRPLAEQGPLDCVIHKLRGGEWKAQLADFAAKNPGVPIVDHPLAIERLPNHDRIAMLHLVSELNVPRGTETFGVPNQAVLHDFSAGAFSRITDLRFPMIAKPLVSDGSAKSHGMSLVYEQGDLHMFKPPLLLQEFVNPGGVIFKVYVAGNYVQCVRRESLPDVAPEQHHSVTFSRASDTSSHKDKEVEWAELPPSSFLEKIAMGLRKATGLRLFSFEVIRDADARHHYLIIDINYFPGYSKMPGYEEFVTDFFWDMVHQKEEDSAAAGSSLSAKD